MLRGVLVSDDPLAAAAGVQADAGLVAIELRVEPAELSRFGIAELDQPRRCIIYCVPCSLLNERGQPRLWEYLDVLVGREPGVQFPQVAQPEYIARSSNAGQDDACVNGTHIRVSVILDWLAAGASVEEILADFPALDQEGVQSAIAYAADLVRKRNVQ